MQARSLRGALASAVRSAAHWERGAPRGRVGARVSPSASAPSSVPSERPPFAVGAPRAYSRQVDRVRGSGALPIYTDYHNGRTRVTTVIRKVRGDRERFLGDLQRVVGAKRVVERSGSVEIQGSCVREVREWLEGLHF